MPEHMFCSTIKLKLKRYIDKLKNVMEVNKVNGVYDIVAKIFSHILDSLKEIMTRQIRTIDTIKSTMTLIIIE